MNQRDDSVKDHPSQKTKDDPKGESSNNKPIYWNELTVSLNYIFSEHWLGLLIAGAILACVFIPLALINVGPLYWIGAAAMMFVGLITWAHIRVKKMRREESSPRQKPIVSTVTPIELKHACQAWLNAMNQVLQTESKHVSPNQSRETAEVRMQSLIVIFQSTIFSSWPVIRRAIEHGIQGEDASLRKEREGNKRRWTKTIEDFVCAMTCSGPFMLLLEYPGDSEIVKGTMSILAGLSAFAVSCEMKPELMAR